MTRSPFKNTHKEIQLIKNRSFIAIIIIVILLIALIARLGYITLFNHQHYQKLANENQVHKTAVAPSRGLIFDRDGTLIATNISVYTLEITPDKSKNLQNTLNNLMPIAGLTLKDIAHFYKIKSWYHSFSSIPVKINLTQKEVAAFSAHQFEFPSAKLVATLVRHYPFSKYTAYPLGYVGRINQSELNTLNKKNYSDTLYVGKSGIEAYYETSLHGDVGYANTLVDARGRAIKTLQPTPAKPGKNLDLSIDIKLQKAGLDAFAGEKGAAVAIDPNNGQVLAMISSPSFNPNIFIKGVSNQAFQKLQSKKALFNRAIRGVYPLASTIKPFIAIEGLMTGTITATFKIFDPGYFKLPYSSHIFHDWVKGGHGTLNVVKAITVSCDTFFYRLANKLGIHKIDDILHSFGFGKPTNIDLLNALSGTVPSPAWKMKVIGHPWFPGNTLITGIGQGYVTTTPLQLADAVAALSMHGQRYQPTLLATAKPIALPSIKVDDATWNTVIEGMKNVVLSPQGTGFRFGRNPPYSVAAKTGTAQVITRAERAQFDGDVPKKYHNDSLFIAFAPVDHPKIAVAVIVEHAERAPIIARAMLDKYLVKQVKKSKKNIKPRT